MLKLIKSWDLKKSCALAKNFGKIFVGTVLGNEQQYKIINKKDVCARYTFFKMRKRAFP